MFVNKVIEQRILWSVVAVWKEKRIAERRAMTHNSGQYLFDSQIATGSSIQD